MSLSIVIMLFVGILLGAGVMALLVWAPAKARLAATEKDLAELRIRADDLLVQRATLSERADRLEKVDQALIDLGNELKLERDEHGKTHLRVTELTTRNEAQRQAAENELTLLQNAETRLTNSFQTLSQQILEAKTQRLDQDSKKLLGPLEKQLEGFQTLITTTWANDQRERGGLSTEIQTLKNLNQRISDDAINLTRALKGDSRAQGAWGEMVLERVLEASGLQVGREYELQRSYQDEEGARARPDVVVHLPGEKGCRDRCQSFAARLRATRHCRRRGVTCNGTA